VWLGEEEIDDCFWARRRRRRRRKKQACWDVGRVSKAGLDLFPVVVSGFWRSPRLLFVVQAYKLLRI
jgi:hypothetical protein